MTCSNMARPDPQVLFDTYKNMFQNTVLGGATVIPESNEWYAVTLNYAMAEEFYAIMEQAWRERDPSQACDDNLLTIAERDGVRPRPAIPAQGYVKLTGTPLTALPAPLSFTINGQTFTTAVDQYQTSQLDDNGVAVVRVIAVVPGSIGNVTNATVTMDTAVAGVSSAIALCSPFCRGEDAETIEAFRQRYMRRLQYHPRATHEWIKEKILEWPCATRVITQGGTCCSCGSTDCGGKMNFYVMFDGTFDNGIAPDYVLKELETWLFGSPQGFGLGQVEIGICGRIVPAIPLPFNIDVSVDDCISNAQKSSVIQLVNDFFSTVEPSQPFSKGYLENSIAAMLGGDVSVYVDVNIDAENLQFIEYRDACSIEPKCDYIPVLGSLYVNATLSDPGDCP